MKIVNLIGGLGNQMFQYALYLALKHRYPDEIVKVNPSLFATYDQHWGLELERVFPIRLDVASKEEIKTVSRYWENYFLQRVYRKIFHGKKSEIIQKRDSEYLPEVFQRGISLYYEGYWQNPRYFADIPDILLREFSFAPLTDEKNRETAEMIRNAGDSVSIHVRRGDYLKAKMYQGSCTEKYYEQAIRQIKKSIPSAHYYIFSDDPQWCSEFFPSLIRDGEKISFIDWNHGEKSFIDMQLMTQARGMIIANSSFSWWAAWLNQRPDKIVIAPKKWLTTVPENDRQLPEWILL